MNFHFKFKNTFREDLSKTHYYSLLLQRRLEFENWRSTKETELLMTRFPDERSFFGEGQTSPYRCHWALK